MQQNIAPLKIAGLTPEKPVPEPDSQDKVVVQPILRPQAAQAGNRPRAAREHSRFGLVAVAFGLLIAALAAVFFYLPTLVDKDHQAVVTEPKVEIPAEPATPPPPADVNYLELAAQMTLAEASRDAFQAKFAGYEKRNAAQWSGDAFASARAAGEEAAVQFKAREFPAAKAGYDKGLDFLGTVDETAARLLKEQLDAGNRALTAGQSAPARKAFEFALLVDGSNTAAQHGLKRAGTLDQVYKLVTASTEAERTGRLPEALKGFQEAARLDPDMTSATEGLARVQNRMASDAYSAAMSQAMGALSAGDAAAARKSLEAAGRIRPGASEIQSGLARASELERQQRVVGHQRQAEEYERAERWKDAVAEYEAALKVDPALQYALQGRDRARPRQALHAQFEALNSNPDRLLTAAVRNQAAAMIAEARKVQNPGPVLSRQVEQLSAALARARVPIAVVLKSDGQTQVALNRTTPLGVFTQHRLDLAPGKYVLVGTRPGYRDVRKELTVMPGQTPEPLTVQCEERI